MARIELSPLAEQDIELIYSYTFDHWGSRQADKYLDLLDGAFAELKKHPELGTQYEYSSQTHSKIGIGKHVIFYRIESWGVAIVRVLHQSRDLEEHL